MLRPRFSFWLRPRFSFWLRPRFSFWLRPRSSFWLRPRSSSLSCLALVALAACGDDGGGTAVDSCPDLCALAEVTTPSQADCVAFYMESQGYPVSSTCPGIATEAQCNACATGLDIAAGACGEAYTRCFDGTEPPGRDAGDGAEDAGEASDAGRDDEDAGRADAGAEGVSDCAELCDLTPVATRAQAECVTAAAEAEGYPVGTVCAGVTTASQCDTCWSTLGIADSFCRDAHALCF